MKTFIYFILTTLISTGALLGALNLPNPFPAFAIAFGIWILFFWCWQRRSQKQAAKRALEQRFENYMRSRTPNKNHP
ncbi:hypothetical protein FO440_18350 [Mucilaginibacter corticis]|uniref:Uncharacterized protein n=1 Tax=Mucilaginibacter corticis TaxID=2597670 RepID=A0A556MIF7_9SPHI|nr:hypothetical protein [Mucilaginibacter corticis]TSJ39700.1 hypothetical protein FO440_18350 [Mucilaginibacter corticis]